MILHCRSWIGDSKEHEVGNHTIVATNIDADEAEAVTNLRNRGRWIIWFIEGLNSAEYWIHLSATQAQILADASKPSLCTSLFWKNASWKLSKKWRRELLRNTTEASKGPEVPLRNTWDHKYSVFLSNPGETQIKNANVKLWFSPIRESNLAERGIKKTSCTCRKRLIWGQKSEWEGPEENSIFRISHMHHQDVHRIHTACMTYNTVCSQSRTWNAFLWLKDWHGPGSYCAIFVRINEPFIRSAMSSPHLYSSSPSQHEAPPGQHDLLRDDTACSTPRNFSMASENNPVGKQRPVGKKRSKTTLSQKYESGGNLRPNTPAQESIKVQWRRCCSWFFAVKSNREALIHTSDDWWNANLWTKSWWENTKWSWNEVWKCSFKMVMEWWFFQK